MKACTVAHDDAIFSLRERRRYYLATTVGQPNATETCASRSAWTSSQLALQSEIFVGAEGLS
ncbi:hypothetical protein D3C83_202600 [compost metagenome]